MTTIELLLLVWAAGLRLERRGDEVYCIGKSRDEVHPALLALIREHKQQLLSIMTDRTPSPTARG